MGTILFRFVKIHAFDRQTDGRAERPLKYRVLHYMQSLGNKMLSYRRETVLQGALVLAKSGRLELGDNIYGHYRCILNHWT